MSLRSFDDDFISVFNLKSFKHGLGGVAGNNSGGVGNVETFCLIQDFTSDNTFDLDRFSIITIPCVFNCSRTEFNRYIDDLFCEALCGSFIGDGCRNSGFLIFGIDVDMENLLSFFLLEIGKLSIAGRIGDGSLIDAKERIGERSP